MSDKRLEQVSKSVSDQAIESIAPGRARGGCASSPFRWAQSVPTRRTSRPRRRTVPLLSAQFMWPAHHSAECIADSYRITRPRQGIALRPKLFAVILHHRRSPYLGRSEAPSRFSTPQHGSVLQKYVRGWERFEAARR